MSYLSFLRIALLTLTVAFTACGDAGEMLAPDPQRAFATVPAQPFAEIVSASAEPRLDWASISIATGDCSNVYDPPPDYETSCPEYQPAPSDGYIPWNWMYQGSQVNPYGCQGQTDQPHRSPAGDVSIHAQSWCNINVPLLRVKTTLQFWTWVFWNTHDIDDLQVPNEDWIQNNARTDCGNGTWRGISNHEAVGPDNVLYALSTGNRYKVTTC